MDAKVEADEKLGPVNDSALDCLALVAQLQGRAIDLGQVRHRLGLGSARAGHLDLQRAARDLNFETREMRGSWRQLQRLRAPFIVELISGEFRLIARIKDDEALLHDPHTGQPQIKARAELEPLLTGWALSLRSREVEEDSSFGFAWFIRKALRYRALFTDVLVASAFVQIFALVTPLFFQVVIDKVVAHRSLTTLEVLAIGLLLISGFETLLGFLRSYLLSHATTKLDVEFAARLFQRLLTLPMTYFASRRVGDTVARLKELDAVRGFLTGSTLTLGLDLIFTFIFLAVMAYFSPLLTVIVLASLPAYAAITLVVAPLLRRRLDERFARSTETQAYLVELVAGVETLKSMALEPTAQRRFDEHLSRTTNSQVQAAQVTHIGASLTGLIGKLTTVLLLWVGAALVIKGDLSVGQLVAFNMLSARVAQPILRLAQIFQEFQQARVSLARLGDIMSTKAEAAPRASSSSPGRIEGQITFDQVQFCYAADAPEVLRGVSFTVRPGEVIGIVGPSGSGKSTIAKLIQRLYLPTQGRVLIDGFDISGADPWWLRRQLGSVMQDTVLFNRSIRENIAIADPALPLEAVIRLAKIAGIHDFIMSLPQGYDTMVGERGANLSGGQRQRLAFARALVLDPRILILDEATSALDYEAEAAIQRNMRQICAGRTAIVIAHRLSTVRFADRILTLENGQLVEAGGHDELIKKGGRYASLHVSMQELSMWWLEKMQTVGQAITQSMRTFAQRWQSQADEFEHQPAALEMIEQPASPLGRMVLWTVCGAFTTAILWATLGTQDIVAVAQGKVVPTGKSKVVQPAETGVVRAIHVRDGQAVKAGEVLVELDPTDALAERERAMQDLTAIRFERARLLALDAHPDDPLSAYFAPEGMPATRLSAERSLLLSAAAERRAQVASFNAELAKLRAELRTVGTQMAKFDASMPMMEKRVEARQNLFERGAGSEFALMEFKQQLLDQKFGKAAAQGRAEEIKASILSMESQRDKALAIITLKTKTELHEAERKIAALEQDLIKADQRARLRTLVAPVDGTVQQLATNTIGGVVTAGQPVLVLVPSDSPPEIEAMILNKDIGFITAGQRAVVKVEAFNFTRYGAVEGTVLTVSNDAIEDKTFGLVYSTRIALAQPTLRVEGREAPIAPGMGVSVEIATGERRLIEYILSPLIRYRQESLKER